MYYTTVKKFFLAGIFTMVGFCFSLSEEARSKGFVYLHEVDPTILVSLRYHSNENFVGKPVNGYKKLRIYLKQVMEEYGFKNYAEEWWHFTLKNEPFLAHSSESYFNLLVE